MKSSEITCADTDVGDLDARYASAQLSKGEAETFEEHFFACDRCWTLVQRAVEIRAVEGRAAVTHSTDNRSIESGVAHRGAARAPIVRRAPAWWNTGASRWLAIAAVATIVVGTWRVDAWRSPASETVTMRGPTDTLHVVTQTRGTTLIASWARAVDATGYRVRLYSASGTVLYQREMTDTTIALTAASLPGTAPGASLSWEIQAMNRMRQVVARSGLRKALFPGLVE